MNILSLASLLLLAAVAYSQPPEGVLEPKICVPKGVECLWPRTFEEIESGSFIVYSMKGLNKEYMEYWEKPKKCSVNAEYITAEEHEMKVMHNQTAKVPVDSFFPLLAIKVRDDIARQQPAPNAFMPDHQGVLSWGTDWQSLKNRTVRFDFFCFSIRVSIEVNMPLPGTKTQAPGSVVESTSFPDFARFTSHGHRPEVMATISSVLAVIVMAILSCSNL